MKKFLLLAVLLVSLSAQAVSHAKYTYKGNEFTTIGTLEDAVKIYFARHSWKKTITEIKKIGWNFNIYSGLLIFFPLVSESSFMPALDDDSSLLRVIFKLLATISGQEIFGLNGLDQVAP